MPKKLNFTLLETELEIITHAINHDKRPEVRQRAIGLRLLHEGHAPQEVARLMNVSQPVVYDWHHRWQNNGLDGLANRPKSGRPRKTNADYVACLEKTIEQDPQELDYPFTIWTTGKLRAHLSKETEIEIGITQFQALLKELDYVYRRPKHDLTNLQDATERETASRHLEELKKTPKQARSTYSLWTKAP